MFLNFVIKVRDDLSDEPKYVAHCFVTYKVLCLTAYFVCI